MYFWRLTDDQMAAIPSLDNVSIFRKDHPRGVVLGHKKYNIVVSPDRLKLPGYSGVYYEVDNPILHEPHLDGKEYLVGYLISKANDSIVGEIYFVRKFPEGNFYSFRSKGKELGRATGQTSVCLEDDYGEYRRWGFSHESVGKCSILEIEMNWISLD